MRNAHLAGKTHPVTGVPFDASGAADFSKYAKATVRFPHTLDRRKDAAAANELAGFQSTPLGYVWHHHPDRQTMHLVPQDIHSKTGHTGSVGLGKD